LFKIDLGGFRITWLLRQPLSVVRTLLGLIKIRKYILLQGRCGPGQSEEKSMLWGYAVGDFLTDTNTVHGADQEAVRGRVGFLDIFQQLVQVEGVNRTAECVR
jgi:hypothetical protein